MNSTSSTHSGARAPANIPAVLAAIAVLAFCAVPAARAANYALFVGINEYGTNYIATNNWLTCCVNDATALRAALTNSVYGRAWTATVCSNLFNSAGTKTNIRRALSNLAARASSGDTVVYFHSSHGGNDNTAFADVYLCSYNADYSENELATDLSAFKNGVKVVVVVDACHSGGLFTDDTTIRARSRAAARNWDLAARVTARMKTQRATLAAKNPRAAAKLIAPDGVGWLTACAYNEFSYESSDVNHGWFTYLLLSGFDYGDTNGDGKASFQELFDFARIRIPYPDQNPKSSNPGILTNTFASTRGTGSIPAGIADAFDFADNLPDGATPLAPSYTPQSTDLHRVSRIFDEADWFSIPLRKNQPVTLTSQGASDVDTELYTYSANGFPLLIRQAFDLGNGNYNFSFTYKPVADGTAFLKVYPYFYYATETNDTFRLVYAYSDAADSMNILIPGVSQTIPDTEIERDALYRITVPEGCTQLTLTLSGGTGDADLYAARGYLPLSDYDQKSDASGNEETITFSNPAAGEYFAEAYAYEAFSGVTIRATLTPNNIPSESSVTDLILSNRAWNAHVLADDAAPARIPVYSATHLNAAGNGWDWQLRTNVPVGALTLPVMDGASTEMLSIGVPRAAE